MATTDGTTSGTVLHDFIQRRMASGERLYALVDAARDRALVSAAGTRFGLELHWLFRGPTPTFNDDAEQPSSNRKPTLQEAFQSGVQSRMANVAPYAFRIPFVSRYRGGGFLDLWSKRLGTSAGILLLARVEPDPLIRHLRSVFHATAEDNHRYYFRFYDPRVLRPFMPACTASEAAELFGPIGQILVESESATSMLCCRAGAAGVVVSDEEFMGRGAASSTGRYRR